MAAFAAGEGDDRGADAEAAGEPGEHAAVFVIGVGDDEHDAAPGAEALEILDEGNCAAIFCEGLGGGEGGCRCIGRRGGRLLGAGRSDGREEEGANGEASGGPAEWGRNLHTGKSVQSTQPECVSATQL